MQTDLRILMRDTLHREPYYLPVVTVAELDTIDISLHRPDEILDSARQHRPDYRTALATVASDELNLGLQRALRSPDVTVGGLWSRQGGYIPDYFALTVAVDLPLFNRNQGNIEAAEATLRSDHLQAEGTRLKIERDVTTAYQRAREADELYRRADKSFATRYAALVEGTVASYQKRNISIIEFADFYESYRTSMMGYYKLQSVRMEAIENLNFAVGTTMFNYR
jgi:cobalt-zinc-cadmium efflux system outer membrane protein